MDNAGKVYRLILLMIYLSKINKNHMLINLLCGELTRMGRFFSVSCDFLIVGHTKFYPDLLFATLVMSLIHQDIPNQLYEVYELL